MATFMFTRHHRESGRTYYIYAIGRGCILDESRGYESIDDLAEGFRKILKPGVKGKIPIIWDAPGFLKDAATQVDLEAQHGDMPPDFDYGIIEHEDRKRIQELCPDGIELELATEPHNL